MNKVIGARIDQKLYEKIKKDQRTQSDIVRTALILFYSHPNPEINVNATQIAVNAIKKTNEGKDIDQRVDAVLRRYDLF